MPAARFADLEGAAEWCASWLALRAALRRPDERLAAVFDLDATLIGRGDERIEPVCALLDRCVALRITPFFVTARSEDGREYTEDQLRRIGLGGMHKRLFMHPAGAPPSAAGRVKRQARERIEAHDYAVCINAGDALHDHFHPTPPLAREALRPGASSVFVTEDGVAHLKTP